MGNHFVLVLRQDLPDRVLVPGLIASLSGAFREEERPDDGLNSTLAPNFKEQISPGAILGQLGTYLEAYSAPHRRARSLGFHVARGT